MYLHLLDPSVKCRHCGKGDLEFIRTRAGRDLYRCVGEALCKGTLSTAESARSLAVSPLSFITA
jgi:ssDNA-binding Zn-finger/Zn-ribbon topoisomerase 1